MDSGGWNSIYNIGTYNIYDDGGYYSVYEGTFHKASFKRVEDAQDYVVWDYNR